MTIASIAHAALKLSAGHVAENARAVEKTAAERAQQVAIQKMNYTHATIATRLTVMSVECGNAKKGKVIAIRV